MFKPRHFLIIGVAALLGWSASGWAQTSCPSVLPTNLDRPGYDYSSVTCTACHFVENLDHTARAAGLVFNNNTCEWQRNGHGWWDSHHSQSRHGSTDNTFCAYCHSPLDIPIGAQVGTISNGQVNAQPISDFQAVTCNACHPSNTLAGAILKANPTAIYNGRVDTLIRGQDPTLISSWIPVLAGQEDQFCLTCHEQRHNTDNPAFSAMYGAGVKCVNCHMAPFQYVIPGGVAEVFHDWKVGENLPYSCGVQGSPIQTCHAEFSTASTLLLIPFMKQQHSDWWNLPPFASTSAANTMAVPAHQLATAADYLTLWQELEAAQKK